MTSRECRRLELHHHFRPGAVRSAVHPEQCGLAVVRLNGPDGCQHRPPSLSPTIGRRATRENGRPPERRLRPRRHDQLDGHKLTVRAPSGTSVSASPSAEHQGNANFFVLSLGRQRGPGDGPCLGRVTYSLSTPSGPILIGDRSAMTIQDKEGEVMPLSAPRRGCCSFLAKPTHLGSCRCRESVPAIQPRPSFVQTPRFILTAWSWIRRFQLADRPESGWPGWFWAGNRHRGDRRRHRWPTRILARSRWRAVPAGA